MPSPQRMADVYEIISESMLGSKDNTPSFAPILDKYQSLTYLKTMRTVFINRRRTEQQAAVPSAWQTRATKILVLFKIIIKRKKSNRKRRECNLSTFTSWVFPALSLGTKKLRSPKLLLAKSFPTLGICACVQTLNLGIRWH